jgi:DEAD/DEAH box helicase
MMINPEIKRLADEILTFIEQREAEQVAYGIYDVTMTGSEVIDNFQPSADIELTSENRAEAIGRSLTYLADEVQIIRFDHNESPADYIFRSRIVETVRLIAKLRQRIVNQNNEKPRHRISKTKRLVADVKFSVASRRVPRRNIEAQKALEPLLNGNAQQQQAARILLEVIDRALPKLRNMSGFQQRAFQEILNVVELEKQINLKKGVVVTASTGAGKTNAFFLPILAKMLIERSLQGKVGIKAICIYPRVALSENQLAI